MSIPAFPRRLGDRSALSVLALALLFTLVTAGAAGAQCSPYLNTAGQFASSAAQNFSAGVTAGAGCTWTAVSNDSWITITSGSSGSGNGMVQYSISANSGPTRNGSMTIAGMTFSIYQSSNTPNCDFLDISSGSINNVPAGGGTFGFSVQLATMTGCSWTATSNASWITVTSGSSGTGDGSVTLSAPANGTGANRVGTVTVKGAGKPFNLTFTAKQLH
jgi:hypothetical protein